ANIDASLPAKRSKRIMSEEPHQPGDWPLLWLDWRCDLHERYLVLKIASIRMLHILPAENNPVIQANSKLNARLSIACNPSPPFSSCTNISSFCAGAQATFNYASVRCLR